MKGFGLSPAHLAVTENKHFGLLVAVLLWIIVDGWRLQLLLNTAFHIYIYVYDILIGSCELKRNVVLMLSLRILLWFRRGVVIHTCSHLSVLQEYLLE